MHDSLCLVTGWGWGWAVGRDRHQAGLLLGHSCGTELVQLQEQTGFRDNGLRLFLFLPLPALFLSWPPYIASGRVSSRMI